MKLVVNSVSAAVPAPQQLHITMTTAESEEQYLQYVFCDEVNFFTIFVSNHGSLCGPSVSAQHNSVLQVRGGGLDYHITYEWGEGVGQITRVGGGCGPDYHITYEWGEGVGQITILHTSGGREWAGLPY